MASRSYFRNHAALEPGLVDIFARISFGAAGAPTIDTSGTKGIYKIVRNGTGDYTLSFGSSVQADAYRKLLNVSHSFDQTVNAGAAPGSPSMYVKDSSLLGSGTVRVIFNSAGTATDPTSGDVVMIRFGLSNSAANG